MKLVKLSEDSNKLSHYEFDYDKASVSDQELSAHNVTKFYIDQAKATGASYDDIKSFVNDEEKLYMNWSVLRKFVK